MKKLLTLLLTLSLFTLLVGCSSNNNSQNNSVASPSSEPSEPAKPSESTESTDTISDNHNVLVVYYSASGTTRRVAQDIADELNADIFEVEPVNVYSSEDLNWINDNSRVTREHNDESLRDVPLKNTTVENWNTYDTIIIGYPIWWGIAAWPLDNFVKDNDFSNKTVIPFCTSSSSGMGQSGSLLESYANSGTWLEGHRFSSGVSSEDVKSWADSLNLK